MNKKFLALVLATFAFTTNALSAATTILHTLAMNSDLHFYLSEIDKNKNIINEQDEAGRTALHCALLHNQPYNAELLLYAGADSQIADHDGFTPLHRVAFNGPNTLIPDLIKHGADCNAVTLNGCTPLHLAVQQNNHCHVEQLLLCNDIDYTLVIDTGDFAGLSPLALAQKLGYKNLVELFEAKNKRIERINQLAQNDECILI